MTSCPLASRQETITPGLGALSPHRDAWLRSPREWPPSRHPAAPPHAARVCGMALTRLVLPVPAERIYAWPQHPLPRQVMAVLEVGHPGPCPSCFRSRVLFTPGAPPPQGCIQASAPGLPADHPALGKCLRAAPTCLPFRAGRQQGSAHGREYVSKSQQERRGGLKTGEKELRINNLGHMLV